ncbi:MAG: hypothetical protein JSV74_01425 [Dehalococcoidia bacterium]|nr:MAG: hypothetical protein JSV74_01425 [Dehalococcoidia bacterium]
MIFASVYAITVGVAIISQWTISLVKKQVPGPTAGTVIGRGSTEMRFHYVAEILTAIVLITAGIGLLIDNSWGLATYLIGIGMLIYTVINSPGYFAQQRQWSIVGLFIVLLILAIISLIVVL